MGIHFWPTKETLTQTWDKDQRFMTITTDKLFAVQIFMLYIC